MIALLNMGFVQRDGVYINDEYQIQVRILNNTLYVLTQDGPIQTTIAEIEALLLQEGL
jgi:hypothetical protein